MTPAWRFPRAMNETASLELKFALADSRLSRASSLSGAHDLGVAPRRSGGGAGPRAGTAGSGNCSGAPGHVTNEGNISPFDRKQVGGSGAWTDAVRLAMMLSFGDGAGTPDKDDRSFAVLKDNKWASVETGRNDQK